jgi:hypothetical protein
MIKFFRKIRWRLLTESPPAGTARLQENGGQWRAGKFSKYLIYAIGEIVLVVIGILIALAVNSQNEQRKEIKQEQIILKQLNDDYKANLVQLENKIEMRNKIISQSLYILNIASNSSAISADSLTIRFATLFMDPTFDPIDINMESTGDIKLIRNDSLKRFLSHWTSDIKAYVESEQIQHQHYISEVIPFMKKVGIMRNVNDVFWSAQKLRMGFLDKGVNNEVLTPGRSSKEIDIQSILENPDLEGLLTFVFTFSQVCNLEGKTLKNRMQQTLEIIENEIE